MDESMLTVSQIAKRLNVDPQTVRRWLRDEQLIGIPFGGKTGWRVSELELQAFLDRRRLAAKETGKAAA